MTRDKEVELTASNFARTVLSSNNVYDDREIKCLKYGFICGVLWADYHPNTIDLWHSAEEDPDEEDYVILCITYKNKAFVKYSKDIADSWIKFVRSVELKQWLYINDLIYENR